MTKNEATKLVKQLYTNGVTNAVELAGALERAGYVSAFTGRPLSAQGAYHMAKYGKVKPGRPSIYAKATQPVVQEKTATVESDAVPGPLALIKKVLTNTTFTAEERVYIARSFLG